MDLQVVAAHLDDKRLSARAFHNDIVATLGSNIVGYDTVARYLREEKFILSTEEASDPDDRKPIGDADEIIWSTLNESPFAFVRQLSRLTYLPPKTA
jgi:hypothetical protein